MRFEPKANKTAITKRERRGGGDRGNAAESDGPRAGADGKQATVEIIFFDFFPLVFVRNFFSAEIFGIFKPRCTSVVNFVILI